MLTELSIKNFAIIDDITIEFDEGLTILTGETGAGKSIIIDAVNLLTGARSSVEYVRHGKNKAEISGLFHIPSSNKTVIEILKHSDIEVEEDMLILERSITHKGKSICKINGKLVTLTILKQIGEQIITIHSQHDTLSLMNEKNHLSLLDQFNPNISHLKSQYQDSFKQLTYLNDEYVQLTSDEQEINHRIDLLRFQLNEIEEAQLIPHEDEKLEEEKLQLQNYETIYQAIHTSYNLFHQEGQLNEKLNLLKDQMQSIESIDETLEALAQETTNVFYQMEDIMFRISDHKDNLFFDEERLNHIESRLFEINRLKKKYGVSIADIQDYEEKIKNELEQLTHKDTRLEELNTEINQLKIKAKKQANELNALRIQTSLSLKKIIQDELRSLYINDAVFDVAVQKTETLKSTGMDDVTFRIATNKGEPLKALSKVASGGELSRVMLALLKVLIHTEGVSTVIFDEIDAGVSGRVAQAIAEKMSEISKSTQVLGITHLPQVAAMADNHLSIIKHEKNQRISTDVKILNQEDKIKEIAKMVTGEEMTPTAKKHAKELIFQSHQQYNKKQGN